MCKYFTKGDPTRAKDKKEKGMYSQIIYEKNFLMPQNNNMTLQFRKFNPLLIFCKQ